MAYTQTPDPTSPARLGLPRRKLTKTAVWSAPVIAASAAAPAIAASASPTWANPDFYTVGYSVLGAGGASMGFQNSASENVLPAGTPITMRVQNMMDVPFDAYLRVFGTTPSVDETVYTMQPGEVREWTITPTADMVQYDRIFWYFYPNIPVHARFAVGMNGVDYRCWGRNEDHSVYFGVCPA